LVFGLLSNKNMKYLNWQEKKVTDFDQDNISNMYDTGFVFTRIDKGIMNKVRSVRIDLDKFDYTSENRRILKKIQGMSLTELSIPLNSYDWSIAKMGHSFYLNKFGPKVMSASKIKEMLTNPQKTNFTELFQFSKGETILGYTIVYANKNILHYSYPFYDIDKSPKDIGLGMMLMSISFAKTKSLRYIYLGSLQRSSDVYKLQFSGTEWFDGTKWSDDINAVKEILAKI
jgi:leucyl-tRNA---protein transferase